MSTTTTTTKIPAPVYAVAGVGDLAYRQLRKLPALTAELAELRDELPARVEQLRAGLPARVEQLRAQFPGLPARVDQFRAELPARVEAIRAEFPAAMNTLVADAYEVYTGLVARGERVVDGEPTPKATRTAPKKAAAKKTVKGTARADAEPVKPVKDVKKPAKSAKTTAATAPARKATKRTGPGRVA